MPRLLRLVGGLATDARLSRDQRLWIGAAALYLASPLDLLPDWIPLLGHLDDVIVAALVLNALFERVPYDILRSHWSGPERQLDRLGTVAKLIAWPVPEAVKRRLFA